MDRGKCSRCPTEIIWVKNENGKFEPFDAKPTRVLVVAGDKAPDGTEYQCAGAPFKIETGHLNHFLTCKHAASFRKPTKKEQAAAAAAEGALYECSRCGATMGKAGARAVGDEVLCAVCAEGPPL